MPRPEYGGGERLSPPTLDREVGPPSYGAVVEAGCDDARVDWIGIRAGLFFLWGVVSMRGLLNTSGRRELSRMGGKCRVKLSDRRQRAWSRLGVC